MKIRGDGHMKNRNIIIFLIAVLLFCTGCSNTVTKEEVPTTITVWHVYGGQTDSPLNDLIDQFNQTVGKQKQINVQVTSVSNTNTFMSWFWLLPMKNQGRLNCRIFLSHIPKRCWRCQTTAFSWTIRTISAKKNCLILFRHL